MNKGTLNLTNVPRYLEDFDFTSQSCAKLRTEIPMHYKQHRLSQNAAFSNLQLRFSAGYSIWLRAWK